MFQSPKMISYRVADLQEARNWYSKLLNKEPAFDSPMAVVFTVGECALALVPVGDPSRSDDSSVAFWSVDDIDAAYRRLLECGATSRTEITLLMLKSRVARVVDPFGNIVGIISASEKNKSVEARPSESALTVAFCRALAANDDREEVKGPDYLAEIFLVEEGKKSLKNPVAREWMIKRFAGTYEYFIARTAYFDEIVQRALRESVPQIVFLGAVYDTRAYRFGNLIKGTRIFELDTLATQQRKRQLLDQAKVAIPPQVDFVSINFERGSLAEALSKAGFDKNKTSVFIWEGVTYYLSPEAVDDTLAFVKSNSPAGSAICFDYVIQAPDISERYGVKQVFEAWRTTYSSERVQFGVDEGRIESFLSKRGFRMLEHLAPMQMEMKFLVLRDGSLAGRVLALFSMVHASVL